MYILVLMGLLTCIPLVCNGELSKSTPATLVLMPELCSFSDYSWISDEFPGIDVNIFNANGE